MFVKAVILFGFAFAVVSFSEANTGCTATSKKPVTVFITSSLNQTGHWISQVGLQQNGLRGQSATRLQVEHSATSCAGSDSVLDTLLTFTVPPPRVRSDYEFFAGLGYYKFHNVPKAFELARKTCEEEGAHLAVINSEKESEVLKTLFSRFSEIAGVHKHLAWIGVQRIGDDHYSILGDALKDTGFARWNPGEPNKGAEYCVAIVRATGGLLDISCTYNGAFICELES